MKKWCVVIFLVALMVMLKSNSDITKPVFKEQTLNFNPNNFELIRIDVSDVSITTKNITSFLENLSLSKVEYEVPKLYQAKFGKLEYQLKNKSVHSGLQETEETVSEKFKQMGYQKEVERIYFYGIKIKSIEVYGRKQEIEAFEKRIKKNS